MNERLIRTRGRIIADDEILSCCGKIGEIEIDLRRGEAISSGREVVRSDDRVGAGVAAIGDIRADALAGEERGPGRGDRHRAAGRSSRLIIDVLKHQRRIDQRERAA